MPSAESASPLLPGASEEERQPADRLAKDDGYGDQTRCEELKDEAAGAWVDICIGFPREEEEEQCGGNAHCAYQSQDNPRHHILRFMMRIRIENSPRPLYLYRHSSRQIKPIPPPSDLSSGESSSEGSAGPFGESGVPRERRIHVFASHGRFGRYGSRHDTNGVYRTTHSRRIRRRGAHALDPPDRGALDCGPCIHGPWRAIPGAACSPKGVGARPPLLRRLEAPAFRETQTPHPSASTRALPRSHALSGEHRGNAGDGHAGSPSCSSLASPRPCWFCGVSSPATRRRPASP